MRTHLLTQTVLFFSPAIIADDFIAKSLGIDPKVMNPELEKAGKSYPLGRLATTDDIANAILYLSSGDSAFVTGECTHCKARIPLIDAFLLLICRTKPLPGWWQHLGRQFRSELSPQKSVARSSKFVKVTLTK